MAGEFTTDMGVLAGITGLNDRFEWYYGDTEPINPRPFLNWAHLSEDLWKQRNLENTAWIVRGKLSEAYFGLAQKGDVKPHGAILYEANNVFTVPENVYVVWVTLSGGGGGAGRSGGAPLGAGGGGADAKICQRIEVTPGEQITVTVGAGGISATTAGGSGTAGGASSFGPYVTCSGGGGGKGSATGGTAGGSGGTDGSVGLYNQVSGMGGDSIFGSGGKCKIQDQSTGESGKGFGGGGSGGTDAGGNGAPGFVLVEW